MNCKRIKRIVPKIKVKKFEDQDVSVVNKSSLKMIGKGRQGAVFKINNQKCMKVYGDVDDCAREYYAMSLGKETPLIPNVFCKGENYVVMEMVYGVDLREFLQSQPLTKKLSKELIKMLITFKQIGYERIDHHKRQIFLQDNGSLKVIDVGRTVWRNRTYPYPRKLLQSLGSKNKAIFIEHVKELAPKLYNEWEYFIQMEEVARQLYNKLENKKEVNSTRLRKKATKLLTTQNTKMHYQSLENLFRKVVKEERIRAEEKRTKRKKKKK